MVGSRRLVPFALLVLACTASPEVPVGSSFGTYTADDDAVWDGWIRRSQYVPMKDGTRIAIDWFLPTAGGTEASEPLPVILHYTRYIRALELEDGTVSSRPDSDPILQHMLRHGYAVAVADARGTGASFGTHYGAFSVEETRDSYEIIEWLARQPWCDGNVGMSGRSYPGMTQYQAATQAPPSLRAIFAEMAGPSAYDFVFRNGTFKQDFIDKWGGSTRAQDLGEAGTPARVDVDEDGSLRDAAIAEHAANWWADDLVEREGAALRTFERREPNGAQWTWETIATIDDTDAIEESKVAVYHLVGWYDIYTTQQPWLYASLEGVPQKMMIGPWVHSGGYGGTVHSAEVLRWYDHWLKGVDNGVMDEEPIHYWVMKDNHTLPAGEDRRTSRDEEAAEDGAAWIATADWPPPGTRRRAFFFAAGPSLSADSQNDGALAAGVAPAEAGRDDYAVDYTAAVGSFSRWMNGYGARREEPENTTFFDERSAEDAKALTYTTPPLDEAMTVVGYPTLHLWITSSHEDGDILAYLEEVDDEGRAHYVSEGALRISHRRLADAAWNNFDLPFHRSNPEDLLAELPDEPTEVVFDLMGTAIVIDAGHRLRITITGADARDYQTWPDPRGTDAPVLSIYRGADHASRVELPVAGAGDT